MSGNMLHRVVLTAAVLLCGLPIGIVGRAAGDERENADQKGIEGTWEIVSAEAGKNSSDGLRGLRMSFKDTTMSLLPRMGTDKPMKLTYKLDPAKKPKQIDTTHELDPGKPISQLGIYELDGDALKLCLEAAGKGRPAKFETKPNGTA